MKGLVGLIVAGTVFDIWAVRTHNETLTCGWHRLMTHPAGRLVLGAGVGVLAVHLTEPWTAPILDT